MIEMREGFLPQGKMTCARICCSKKGNIGIEILPQVGSSDWGDEERTEDEVIAAQLP